MEPTRNTRAAISLPAAIIIAGAIIAIAVIWTQRPVGDPSDGGQGALVPGSGTGTLAPVTADDHILGNPAASVKIVEFSDPSCPYCKTFNHVMTQIMSEYGPAGTVAWVYRQFALDKPDETGALLHPNAGREALAMECAAALGGNTAFWSYEKKWYETFPLEGGGRPAADSNAQIAATAKSVGLDPVSFNDCIASKRFKDRLDRQFTDGINAGVTGTPYLVILTPSGNMIPLAGAQDYATLKRTIDILTATGDTANR